MVNPHYWQGHFLRALLVPGHDLLNNITFNKNNLAKMGQYIIGYGHVIKLILLLSFIAVDTNVIQLSLL